MPAFSSHSTPRRVLKGHMKNTSTLTKLCATLNIHYSDMMQEILGFTRQTAADDRRLPADPTELGLIPVEGFAQLEIPVADFRENDRFQIHGARCTGTKAFRSSGPRNDWVWVHISKKSVCCKPIGIAAGCRKSAWSILSAQRTLRGPQQNVCILVCWVQYNPHPVRPVHPDGPFHRLISRRTPR